MICSVSLSSPSTTNQYDPTDTSVPRRRGSSALLRALSQMPKLSSELPLMEARSCALLLLSHRGKPQVVVCSGAQQCPSSPAGCPLHCRIPRVLRWPACAGSISARGRFSRVGRLRDSRKCWGSSSHTTDKMEALLCLNPVWGIRGSKRNRNASLEIQKASYFWQGTGGGC